MKNTSSRAAVRASQHAKGDEGFCTFLSSLVVLVLVCLVVLVHVGAPMLFYTCSKVFMNTESGVERGAESEQGARASESEIASEIAGVRDEREGG